MLLSASALLTGFGLWPSHSHAKPMVAPEEIEVSSEPSQVPSTSKSSDIANEAEFLSLSKELAGERFTKFVIDVRTGEIFFFDVNVFRLHSDFVFSQIYHQAKTPTLVREYNRNYSSKKPEFLLGYLSHHLSADIWTFAFWEGDMIDPVHVRTTYAKLRKSAYFADRLRFRPDSTWQERVAAQLKSIPAISNDQLYYYGKLKVFTPGVAVGTLRIVERGRSTSGESPSESLHPDEILLTGESLGEIPPVAGIVSETFTTPLSRMNLQARMWGIPFVGEKGAVEKYRHLDGKRVLLQATDTGVVLREANEGEREISARSERDQKPAVPSLPLDENAKDIRLLSSLRRGDVSAYGVRASILGEVSARKPMILRRSMLVVPFAFYREHFRDPELRQMVESVLSSKSFREDPSYRKRALQSLQKRIHALPFDPSLLEELRGRVRAQFGDRPLLVRISTNAELSPEFRGIGRTERIREVLSEAELETVVKNAWADAWSLAYAEERLRLGISAERFAVALLIQEKVENTVSGSLVTAHLYDPSDRKTVSIQAYEGGEGIGADAREAEETVLYDYENKGIRILTHRSQSGGHDRDPRKTEQENGKELLVSGKRASALASMANALREIFPDWGVLSVEWTFQGDEVTLEQFSPF